MASPLILPLSLTADDLHLLPPSMQELAQVVGITVLLDLVAAYGGTPLYVPSKGTSNQELLRVLGKPAFTALQARYAGERIEIALCERALRILVHRNIRADLVAGMSKAAIARKYRYTVRGIFDIEMRGEPADKNLSLF
ncbi:MAG: hypothetical protein PXX73_04750 [Sideroxydans sp.]|nr:hypothetical protein [Sideroxydans sp.]